MFNNAGAAGIYGVFGSSSDAVTYSGSGSSSWDYSAPDASGSANSTYNYSGTSNSGSSLVDVGMFTPVGDAGAMFSSTVQSSSGSFTASGSGDFTSTSPDEEVQYSAEGPPEIIPGITTSSNGSSTSSNTASLSLSSNSWAVYTPISLSQGYSWDVIYIASGNSSYTAYLSYSSTAGSAWYDWSGSTRGCRGVRPRFSL